jgi:hypothetical protein
VHAKTPNTWCARCEEEWQEDLEFAIAQVMLKSPSYVDMSRGDRAMAGAAMVNLVRLAFSAATMPLKKRAAKKRAEREFVARDRPEIEGWRAKRKSSN